MEKKTIKRLFVAACIAVVGLMAYLAVSLFCSKGEKAPEGNVTAVLPDGEVQRMSDSKSEAFRGNVSTDAYFAQLGADEEISLVSSEPVAVSEEPSAAGESDDAAVARTFGAPPAAAPQRRSSGGGAPRQMSEQERLEYERRRAEMVRDVLNGGGSEGMPDQVGHDGNGSADSGPRAIELPAGDASDGIVSSLDDDFEDAAVQYEGAKRPFRCMFVRDERLRSGQRVTLRLLEDYVDGGVRIPANTHLAAVCKIGDRLELQVRSLEMNGRIVPLALDAFDTDGLQGIYCPETTAARGARQASQEAISTAGTTFGGLVGDIASTVIRTGASIARSASGEVSVSVVSGYEFYLVKSERK